MKKINKKIFPEDFFDSSNKIEDESQAKNKSKSKDHPKLLNPSNTIKIIPNQINVIKEEAFEESIEQFQLKKNNLKIIIPDKSNDELEPSTSGSSNVKLSPNTPRPLIGFDAAKNKFNLYPNKKNENIINNNKEKDEEKYKITAHFNKEDFSNNSSKDNKALKRPSTPNTNRYRNIYNPPLTCDNKNLDKYVFKYDFETNKNGVIVPKDSKINKIKRQNLFKVGHKNNNINNKKNNKISSKIGDIFGSQGNSPRNNSLISFKNNINEKVQNKNKIYNNNNINKNNNKINNLKKNKNNNYSFNKNKNQNNGKKQRANSMKINKRNELKKNDTNESETENQNIKIDDNKERKKNNSINKNNALSYLHENKLSNVQNKLEKEINNLFKILPEDFEKDPEIKNNFELIVKNIHGIKDYICKNTQYSLGKKNNLNKNKK